MKFPFRFGKRQFLYTFSAIVVVLFLIKCICPSVLHRQGSSPVVMEKEVVPDSIMLQASVSDSILTAPHVLPRDLTAKATGSKHKIYSVRSYQESFPDVNDVQIATAKRLGVTPIKDRAAAQACKHNELVYIGSNPYYYVKKLHNSIPYLVPKAQLLLTHIARTFIDSLMVKNIRPSLLIVTSLMRSRDDVSKLRQHNSNASNNSCHCYGTTFDVSYSKYQPIQDPDGPRVRQVRDDTLKWVLSEVLHEQRLKGTCYVKYEVHQGCFHITVR